MAPDTQPQETHDRRGETPARLFAAGLTLIALWALVLVTLTAVFEPGRWIHAAMTICAGTILVSCLIRTLRRNSRTSAGIAGASAGALGLVYWTWRSGRAGAWMTEPRELFLEARGIAYDHYAPLDPSGPLEDLALLAILLGVSATALLLTGSGMPLAAGVVASLFMLVPHAVVGVRMSGTLLLLTGLILALLAWLGSPRRGLLGLGASGLALAMAAGAMAVAPPTRDRIWNESVVAAPVSTSVPDVTISLANDLRYRSNARVFSFTSEVPGPLRFTLATLSDFSGGRWLPDDDLSGDGLTVTNARSPAFIPPSSEYSLPAEATASVSVTIDGLVSEWLPLPQSVTQVEAGDSSFDPDQWLWTDSASTARSESETTRRNDSYSAEYVPILASEWPVSLSIDPASAMTLHPYGTDAPDDLEPYLRLPDGIPSIITESARQVPPEVQDRLFIGYYLQEWFTSGGFAYDESAPYSPGMDQDNPYDVMEALLTERRGFCVHYASTFAVMARYLGAPTRVAIGYAAWSDGQDETVVRGRELHAWPEIFVEEIGWVPFEPTPGGAGARSMTGEPADLSEGPVEEDVPEEEPPQSTAEPEETPAIEETPDMEEQNDNGALVEGADVGNDQNDRGTSRVACLALVVAVALLLPTAIRRVRSIRRVSSARRGVRPAQNAWDEFRDTVVDLGLTTHGAAPRAQTAEALVDLLEERGILDGDAAHASRRLAEAMTAERYGDAAGSPRESQELLATARRALWATASRKARLHALLAPRSLLHRRGD